MNENIKIKQGSGNIVADLGFGGEEANEALLKAQLCAEIARILEHRKLTQTKAARILEINKSEIARLNRGEFSYYSIEQLLRFLVRLNCKVSIRVARPEQEAHNTRNFKELLASCPLDGIDLTRTREFPRDFEFADRNREIKKN